MTRRILLTVVALVLATPAIPRAAMPGQAAAARTPAVSVTEHAGTYNGQAIRYTATVAETFVPGPDGTPAGSMVTTTYIRQDVTDRATRPVLFAFNGGPGASSTPLHLNAFGPRRYVTAAGRGREMGDNPYSPLDAMDLVFIDPIGTGFSRLLPGADGRHFWSVSGDAASVKAFILRWLAANGREASPRFLCGESYGTTRAAQIVSLGSDLSFDGVLLLSMTGAPEGPDLPYVMLLPTYAATAAFHGKVDAAGRTPAEIFDEALRFARRDYVSALIQGGSLAPDEKTRVAAEMSRRIGLPAAFIEAKDLRVGKLDFMLNLLKDRGLRTGQIDARVTGRLEDHADKKPPYDDPSMFSARGGPQRPTAHLYFTEELKFPAAEQYNPLNLEINAKWTFDVERAMRDPVSLVGAAMKDQPTLRLFWAAGYYDITTPLANGKYILDHAGVPPERLTIAAFPTGHMPYEGDENLSRFNQAVRDFVTGKPYH
jgi:carboxypeptidase C (cathepsin A)